MAALALLGILGPVCCLLGFAIGANLSRNQARQVLQRLLLAVLLIAGAWLLWPARWAKLSLHQHVAVYVLILASGGCGGWAHRKALMSKAPSRAQQKHQD